MNYDLKLRLKPQSEVTNKEWGFFWTLVAKYVRLTNCVDRFELRIEEINTDDDDTGYVTYDGERFEMVLDPRISFGTLTDYLMHEFAHIGTWFVNEHDDHGPMFGVEFARLYREYLKLYERML